MPQSTTTGVVVEIKADMEFLNAAGKAYKGTRFTYSDDRSGDIKAQKFHENVMKYSPEVAKGLNTLVKDDEFTMVKEKKEGSDFWNAISISKGRDTGVVDKDKLSEKKVFATAENIFQWVMNHKEEVVDGNDVEMGEMT